MSVGALLAEGGGVGAGVDIESLELPPQAVNPNVAATMAIDNKLFLDLNMCPSKYKWINNLFNCEHYK
jgi:hypothetical protein